MCNFFGISRASYYAWMHRLEHPDRAASCKQLVQEAYEKSHQTYGYRRITLWIRKHKGVSLNHKTVLRLMHVSDPLDGSKMKTLQETSRLGDLPSL